MRRTITKEGGVRSRFSSNGVRQCRHTAVYGVANEVMQVHVINENSGTLPK
jgi:hypothetical protein